MRNSLDDEFPFLDGFQSFEDVGDKDYILRVIRKKDCYLLEILEGEEVIQKQVIKELSILKQQFEHIEEDVFLYWKDKKGNFHILLKTEKNHTEDLELVDYEKYANDVIFRMVVNKIQNHAKKKRKVKSQKKATPLLIQKKKVALATLTAAGIGCFTIIFGFLGSDDLDLVDPIVHIERQELENKVDRLALSTSVEMVIDQTMELMEEMKDPALDSIPVAADYEQARLYSSQLKEEMEDIQSGAVMALYDQPLLPLDLNIYMYQMATKYEVSYTALMAIAHVESDGNFNNHGVIGCSGDEGIMQINPANYPVLCAELGFTPEQIKDDDKANIECAAFLLRDICQRNRRRNGGVLNEDEMYREYNGGGNFKDIPATLKYLEYANRSIHDLYNSEHLIYVKNPEEGLKRC